MEPLLRILMVDDVTRYQSLYEQAITDAIPASVCFATNGEEALTRLVPPLAFDLVILDLNMPRLNGEETLKRLRLDPAFDHVPIVILTGDTSAEVHRRLLDLGADDFVEKGAPPEIFVARLKSQLRHKLTIDRLARVAVDMDLFAAGVLHDIRNLETTIKLVTDVTSDSLANAAEIKKPQILEDLTILEDKSEQLGRYATEIIAMVRDTHRPLHLQRKALPPLIHWAMRMVGSGYSEENAKPSFEIQGELSPVVADEHFLQLILLNLLQNSVKYRREGVRPHIIVSQRAGRSEYRQVLGPSIITCVRDNGRGIKAYDLRKVFEPFVRGSNASGHEGFGLGLSLVAKVMATMSGRAWAEIPADGLPGTVICLELPAPIGRSPEYII